MYSTVSGSPKSSSIPSPQKGFHIKGGHFSEINFFQEVPKKDEEAATKDEGTDLTEEMPASFKSPLAGVSNVLKVHEKPSSDSSSSDSNKKKSTVSPESYGQFRHQQWQHSDGDIRHQQWQHSDGDIRHQLLVQRMLSNHDGADHPEPRTSSPLRKIRICTVASGLQTITVSPSSGSLPQYSKFSEGKEKNSYQWQTHSTALSPYIQSPKGRAHEMQEPFKTPNRRQHYNSEAGTSHPMTPSLLSPASTPSYVITPGRKFCNPFEIDHDKMHMPLFSPTMFRVTEPVCKELDKEKETFWSVEHSALMMPVEIKEGDIRFQHRYQQRIDQEQDARVQTAINKFFSNKHIVPSPWSERVEHYLPRTPGTAKSVSSQTAFSVPPDVDLFAQLEGRYLLPDYKTDPSPASDSFGTSFIRRKLLTQLNGSDGELFGSPSLPARTPGAQMLDSPSPIKQTTPEWEKGTPNKVGSKSHFSSSPICSTTNEMGHYNEHDPLASPDLSPVSGRMTKAIRSSEIFCSNQSDGSPRAVMQLDFSSILDDPDGQDKTGTLLTDVFVPQDMDTASRNEAPSTLTERYFLASNVSQESDDNSNNKLSTDRFQGSMLTSACSTESTSDAAAVMRQSQSSQDTGYQTTSLQTTNHESTSNYNLTSQDVILSSTHNAELRQFPVTFGSDLFSDIKQVHVFQTNKVDRASELNYRPNRSFQAEGSFLDLAFESSKKKSSSADDVAVCRKTEDACRFRKVRTISDMRHLKEKSSVSRDLIQSFNEEQEKTDLSYSTHSSWPELNSSSFVPVACRIIEQNNPTSAFSEVSHGHQEFHTSLPKRPDENDNSHDGLNQSDISIQSAASFFNSSLEKKVGNTPVDVNMSEEIGTSFEHTGNQEQHPSFLFDDRTLQEARLLLSRSEEFRKKIVQPQALESDSLYQVITGCAGSEHPFTDESLMPLKELNPKSEALPYRLELGEFSSSTSRVLASVQKTSEALQGSRLGSEIAAEILKRAGDDLAMLTNLLERDQT